MFRFGDWDLQLGLGRVVHFFPNVLYDFAIRVQNIMTSYEEILFSFTWLFGSFCVIERYIQAQMAADYGKLVDMNM